MHRYSLIFLFGLILAAGSMMAPVARSEEPAAQNTEEERKGEEVLRLLERSGKGHDRQRIADAELALKLLSEVERLPSGEKKDDVAALLWWELGASYQALGVIDRTALEKAIEAFEKVLDFKTLSRGPLFRAVTLAFVCKAYLDRQKGKREDNVEQAISGCAESLQIFAAIGAGQTTTAGSARINLGDAYRARVAGNPSDNLEKAIGEYQIVVKGDRSSGAWRRAHQNLAQAYLDRTREDRLENVEKAIAAYREILAEYTVEREPLTWAEMQIRMGNAYIYRLLGRHEDNVEKAIEHIEAGLAELSKDQAVRERWQWMLGNDFLAGALMKRSGSNRVESVERAIAVYNEMLGGFSRDTNPTLWSVFQDSLGDAYLQRIKGNREENIEKAVGALKEAAATYSENSQTRDIVSGKARLGSALLLQKKWSEAFEALSQARDAYLLMVGQGIDPLDARVLIEAAGTLFADSAFLAAQRGELEQALTFAAEGRARQMAIALKLQALNLTDAQRERLEALRAAIRGAEAEVVRREGLERVETVDRLVRLREEMVAVVKSASQGETSEQSILEQARTLIASGGAVIVPIVTKANGKILIVSQKRIRAVDVPELTTNQLNLLLGYGDTKGWLFSYDIHYLSDQERNARWPEWMAAVSDIGQKLWTVFGKELHQALREEGVANGARVYWLPSGALGILPFGLAKDPTSGRRLSDDYEIVYAPSLAALASSQRQMAKPAPKDLAAIVNPTGDLEGSEQEGRLVASYFDPQSRTVLYREAAKTEAVLAALKGKSYWHFASHGTFSWADSRKSALVLNENEYLTVDRLLQTDNLGRPRLVVLSACETGLYDIRNNPDEFIGLPGTFTALGAVGVVGSLWPVSDAATALLIAKFYELHMGVGVSPPTALRKAQSWLRDATNTELSKYARTAAKKGRLTVPQLTKLEADLSENGLKRSRNAAAVEWVDAPRGKGKKHSSGGARLARPYAHPYFWAGFVYTGL